MQQKNKKDNVHFASSRQSVSIHRPPTPRFSIVSKSFVVAPEAGIDRSLMCLQKI